ncbi:MAG: hypothetical protein HY673_03955 [Chloroflexi bacterium]|nr:hypothetical protein [Chloroflexota bacterium]
MTTPPDSRPQTADSRQPIAESRQPKADSLPLNYERLAVGLITLSACLVLIAADARGDINIGKFGYAGIGSWVTLIVHFYFRKNPGKDRP